MAWPMVAATIGASVIGGMIQSRAQDKASQSYSKSANAQTRAIMEMYYQTRKDLSPYMAAGEWALGSQTKPKYPDMEPMLSYGDWMKQEGITPYTAPGVGQERYGTRPGDEGVAERGAPAADPNRYAYQSYVDDYNKRKDETTALSTFREGSLLDMLQKGPGEFEADPGYQFRLGEGEKAIDRASAARGGFFSGARGKALVEYGQDFASNEYSKFMNRYYKKLDAYGNLMNVGQASAARVGAAGQTAVGQGAGVQMGAGLARASSYINKGDIWGGVAQEAGGMLADYGGGYRQPTRDISHTQILS